MAKKEKTYRIRDAINGIEVAYDGADGRTYSACSERQIVETRDADGKIVSKKLETRKQCIQRLCKLLGIEY